MLQISLFATTKFVAFCIGYRRWRILLSDAVPQVFDELEAFSPSEFEERCKFRIHASAIQAFEVRRKGEGFPYFPLGSAYFSGRKKSLSVERMRLVPPSTFL